MINNERSTIIYHLFSFARNIPNNLYVNVVQLYIVLNGECLHCIPKLKLMQCRSILSPFCLHYRSKIEQKSKYTQFIITITQLGVGGIIAPIRFGPEGMKIER